MATKICTKCHNEKPTTDFGARKTAKDGLKPHCRACEAAYQRAQYEIKPDILRERKRLNMAQSRQDPVRREQMNASRRGNPVIAARQREYLQELRHKRFFIWRSRNWNSRHRAAVTPQELRSLWKRQRGRCALSNRKLDRTAHLDHIEHLSRNGAPTVDNLRWIDPYVNVARNNMTDAEFVEMCRQVVAHAMILSPMN